MFILILTYIEPISEIEKHLEGHKEYLDTNYKQGVFIASGRQNPRVGGVILCSAQNRDEVDVIIQGDPFYIHKLAKYSIIEFIPTKFIPEFEAVLAPK